MAMYNMELQNQVREMFRELHAKADEVISSSSTYRAASERIMNVVSSKISAESEGYIVDIYTSLVEKIKKEDFFQDPEHLNAFYRLNLRETLNDKYHFEIDSVDSYKSGIDYKEINQLYTSIGAAAGTLAVGGILKFVISSAVSVPFAIIIAGAVVVACATYFKIVPQKNKKDFKRAVNRFLNDLETDILNWIVDVEEFFESQIRILYMQKF